MGLFHLLHLDDELSPALVRAKDIYDGFSGTESLGDDFCVVETDVHYVVVRDEGIEESDGGVLVLGRPEGTLESEVGADVGEHVAGSEWSFEV